MATIAKAITAFLDSVFLARSENTARSYTNALKAFSFTLEDNGLHPEETDISELKEDAVGKFAVDLKEYSPATEQLYLIVVAGFYEFLAAEGLSEPNLPRLRLIIRQRARKPGQRLPQFPREDIEKIIDYVYNLTYPFDDKNIRANLIVLRDRAFLLTLADTGLRVHEACNLRRGDIDWFEHKALIIGKGNRENIVRFSDRSLICIKDYLNARGFLDGNSGRPLSSLPLFARHDRGAGNKVKPITTTTGRKIVSRLVLEAVGKDAVGTITPHSFRHYFVTTILLGSGGNLKLAQKLARHSNIAITQRYAHLSDDELDKGYNEIFESQDF